MTVPMRVPMVVIAVVLAGCAAQDAGIHPDGTGDAGTGGDAPPADCQLALTFNPPAPIAGPSTTIRVTAQVFNAPGVIAYSWHVQLNGTPIDVTPAQADGSEIDFRAAFPGTYRVSLSVTGSPVFCSPIEQAIDVSSGVVAHQRVRLRVVPPSGVAPPFEQVREIIGDTSASFGIISVDRGLAVNAMVRGPSGGVPAYLRFAPSGAPEAIVEAFSNAQGMVATRLLAQPHSVLVIPSVTGLAPLRLASLSSPGSLDYLDLAAGSVVSGRVVDPAGAPLAGARLQLSIGGVVSTVATTAGDGSFAVRAQAGSPVVVEVTPPAASGLPRLSASSTGFDLAAGLQIAYSPSLVPRDLAGLRVQRSGAPVARATLMVVGSLAAVGSVTAGISATATGEVRIAAAADATGTLPSTLVPAAALLAVVTVSAGDLAVAALDTTSGVPAALDAPPALAIAPLIEGPSFDALAGAVLDAVPLGALAMAGAPPLHVVADPDGAAAVRLAPGGHYDLRFRDPAGRAATLVVPDRVAETVDAEYRLPAAISVTGMLMLGGTQALANASVQILCDSCSGLDRARPIAEASSDPTGVFALAVPQPP